MAESQKLRVLAVTNLYPSQRFPTSGTFVEQQICGLRKVGLDVEVLFVDRKQNGIREYFHLGRRIQQSCKEFSPDIVHSMYGGIIAETMTRVIRDRPTVVSFCGSDLLGEKLSGFLRNGISGLGVRASWKAAERSNGIIVKSRNLLDALPRGIPMSKVKIIPNGVNLDRFRLLDRDECREQLGWTSKYFHLLFPTNSGDPCKRYFLAKAAIEIIRKKGIQTELHQLCGVPHNEVPLWLNASDAIILTSLHEGSPNIIKEALACNLPIVSVDVGDVKERIQKIEGCYIAMPDPDDLGEKLQLVQAGKQRVSGRCSMQELSLEKVAIRLRNLYEELL
ncbi:glycosyltransferase [Nitrospira sp. T9]|uniref:glycosyltransferase n=1 Tax=unclassified Nitrospira TaxID=2652172 RepID=UPI003F968F11